MGLFLKERVLAKFTLENSNFVVELYEENQMELGSEKFRSSSGILWGDEKLSSNKE